MFPEEEKPLTHDEILCRIQWLYDFVREYKRMAELPPNDSEDKVRNDQTVWLCSEIQNEMWELFPMLVNRKI